MISLIIGRYERSQKLHLMGPKALQTRASVCQFCESIASRNSVRPKFSRHTNQSRDLTTTRRVLVQKRQTPFKTNAGDSRSNGKLPGLHDRIRISVASSALNQSKIDEEMRGTISLRDKIISSSSIPTELEILKTLACCGAVAENILDPADHGLKSKEASAVSALLSVEERAVTKSPKVSATMQKNIDQLSSIAHSIIIHPTVFITPGILREYVSLQSRLKKPDTFPSVFKLYASKPLPKEGSSSIRYTKQNPNKVANAINIGVADMALKSAIDTKQLHTAIDLVDAAYNTKAFRRNKFARKGLIPAIGVLLSPAAAYTVASQLSAYQSTMAPGTATNIAFVGIMAYVGFTATIGFVAVTTANDQMNRVTWIEGMPLRERWVREEERAAIDRIAGAWGFRETWRRGEEEGEEWEALREWIGRKGMILDRTELMEGME